MADSFQYTERFKKEGIQMFNIIIVGAGGFGREVHNWAMNSFPHEQYQIKGFLSNNSKDLDHFGMKVGILGDENTYEIEATDRFLFAIGNIDAKKTNSREYEGKGSTVPFFNPPDCHSFEHS